MWLIEDVGEPLLPTEAAVIDLATQIPIRTVVDPYRMEDANLALARLRSGDVAGAAVLTMPETIGT